MLAQHRSIRSLEKAADTFFVIDSPNRLAELLGLRVVNGDLPRQLHGDAGHVEGASSKVERRKSPDRQFT